MDKQLLDILVCPVCKNALQVNKEHTELLCEKDKLAFPVRDDIPVMLVEEARKLEDDNV
ncbi:Trm112 family protein [Magnetococcus sp. PR-3]